MFRYIMRDSVAAQPPQLSLGAFDNQNSVRPTKISVSRPRIFNLPEPLTSTVLTTAFQDLLFDLLALEHQVSDLFSKTTSTQLSSLLAADVTDPAVATSLYFACTDVWRAYWSHGNR